MVESLRIALIVLGAYLAAGLAFLALFELTTHKLRDGMKPATEATQLKIANSASTFNAIAGPAGRMPVGLIGTRYVVVAVLLASWLFWPVLLVGYLRSKGDKDAQ